jgi:hypothetical protein
MTGPLIASPGSSPTNVGLGLGDNATGFYRVGNAVIISLGGGVHTQFLVNETMMVQRLNMAMQPIMNVADATQPQDALNRRAADARYLQLTGGSVNGQLAVSWPLTTFSQPVADIDVTTKAYVDLRRAQTVAQYLTADVTISDDDWHDLGPVRFTINRGGQSLVAVTITGNVNMTGSNMLVLGFDVGGASGTVQRNVWLYGYGAETDVGFAAVLIVQQNTPVVDFPVRVKRLAGQPSQEPGQWSAFTLRGGTASELLRTQIVITDLGPALSAQEEPSDDDQSVN